MSNLTKCEELVADYWLKFQPYSRRVPKGLHITQECFDSLKDKDLYIDITDVGNKFKSYIHKYKGIVLRVYE